MMTDQKNCILVDVDKESLVNDWLRNNEGNFFEEANLVYPSSPVLCSSIINKRTPRSPIVGNLKKRPRKLFSLRGIQSEKGNSNLDADHQKRKNTSFSLSYHTEQSGCRVQRSQENNLLSLRSQSPSNGSKSPVLNDKVRLRKLRQKRLSEGQNTTGSIKLDTSLKSDKCLKSKRYMRLEESDQISRILNVKTSDQKSNSELDEREIIQAEGIENETFFEKEVEEEVIIIDDKFEEEEIEQNFNESMRIEVCSKTHDSDTVSDFIEDVDTPDVVLVNSVKVPVILKENITDPCHSPSKDSDETFFSRAGSGQSHRQQPSEKISQIETMSPKPVNQSFVNILRSQERKRKAKKGSLAAKLETLVNREKSDMRMWQHRVSQPTFQSVQFVYLRIKDYHTSYNRQFLECHLIDDINNLLKDFINLQNEPGSDSQPKTSKTCINNLITVIIIPEIVGVINAKRGQFLKVYPHWEILDQENFTISVTCCTVDEKDNLEMNGEESSESVKTTRTEKFDCPCIQKGRVVEDCNLRFDAQKTNVIKEIFNIS